MLSRLKSIPMNWANKKSRNHHPMTPSGSIPTAHEDLMNHTSALVTFWLLLEDSVFLLRKICIKKKKKKFNGKEQTS